MDTLPLDLLKKLKKSIAGEVRIDPTSRLLYSTDASIYQIEPLGVVLPKSIDDLQAIVELASEYKTPVLARGAGSSLAGQAVGRALVVDCSRYLNKILEINPEERTATAEPGAILTALNRVAGRYGLVFGPDPASADRATMGGVVANNATGAHSIQYGMAVDHLVSTGVVLADGSLADFEAIDIHEAEARARVDGSVEAALYRRALEIRGDHADTIRAGWPKVWRRASGYNLNYLLPWSPSSPPEWAGDQGDLDDLPIYPPIPPKKINLAALMAGSEGTLAVLREVKVRLVPKPEHTLLGVLVFQGIAEACDVLPELLVRHPSAIELIPGSLIRLARGVPAYARQLTFVQGDPEAMLVVEFSGDDPGYLAEKVRQLGTTSGMSGLLVTESKQQQAEVWNVRKVGLGLIMSSPDESKPIAFIEDITVPVESLGTYVRGMERILADHGTYAEYYAHASAGCLHIRPALNLKTAPGVKELRAIAEETVSFGLGLGGAVSGEHGEGLARSEWMERAFGPQIVALFRAIKQAADPEGLMNPGKILDAPPMNRNLRFGTEYHARAWQPVLDFSGQGSLAGAIEMCNGAGVCRKREGVMCPSFQVTQEEMHSTRGRANLLRSMISGRFPGEEMAEAAVFEALDLCLACKGCKSECPSAVDMAKLKYEFADRYYAHHRRRARDYLFAYIDRLARAGAPFAPLVNGFLRNPFARRAAERFLGLASEREFPKFRWAGGSRSTTGKTISPDVLLLTDAFTRYFHPETERAALRALEGAGLHVQILPVLGAGRTLISKGFLKPARAHAARLLDAIERANPERRLPVVGVEPSEIFTLSDEYPDFFPGEARTARLARRAWMVDEFLVRLAPDGIPYIERLRANSGADGSPGRVLLHGHCYQKARPPAPDGYPTGVAATAATLSAFGYTVEIVDDGCCGMAGGFGYEAEHYEISMAVGELALFPAIRSARDETIIAAAGTSCRSQIQDGTGRAAVHPISLIAGP